MRLYPGSGVEYGVDWVVREILSEELTPVDLEEEFEDFVRRRYPEETTVGWMTLDTVSILKEMDPVSWRCSRADWESEEESDGTIITFDYGATYYWSHEVEAL